MKVDLLLEKCAVLAIHSANYIPNCKFIRALRMEEFYENLLQLTEEFTLSFAKTTHAREATRSAFHASVSINRPAARKRLLRAANAQQPHDSWGFRFMGQIAATLLCVSFLSLPAPWQL
jgi:hypothetical protein